MDQAVKAEKKAVDRWGLPIVRARTFFNALLAFIFVGILIGSLFGSIALSYRFFSRLLE